jgi:hypothetical protein
LVGKNDTFPKATAYLLHASRVEVDEANATNFDTGVRLEWGTISVG